MNSGFRKYVLRDFERERTGCFNTNPLPKFNDKEAVERWRRSQEVAKHWQEIKNKWKRKRGLSGGSHSSPTPPTPDISDLSFSSDMSSEYDDENDEDEEEKEFYNDGDYRLSNYTSYFDIESKDFWSEPEVRTNLPYREYDDARKNQVWKDYLVNKDTWEAIRMSKNDTGEVTEFGRVINSALKEFETKEEILNEYIESFTSDVLPFYKIYNAIEIRKYYGRDPDIYPNTFEQGIKQILYKVMLKNDINFHRRPEIEEFNVGERLKIVCANEVHYQLMRNGVNHRACKLIVNQISESFDQIERGLFDYNALRRFISAVTHRNPIALEGINQIIDDIRQRFHAVVATDINGHYILEYNLN